MKLDIYSLDRQASFVIESIAVQSPVGSCVVYQGHAPMILPLASKTGIELTFADGSSTVLFVLEGVMKVTRTEVTLLVSEWYEESNWSGTGRVAV
jgi:F0F1-type ATP synthase epsilon subunit